MRIKNTKIRKKNIKYQYELIYFIVATFALPVQAAPSIQNITGSVVDGGQITINSANGDFGTGPTILAWDRFENGFINSDIQTGGAVGNGPWSTWIGGENGGDYIIPHYSNDDSRITETKFIRADHKYNGANVNNAWFAYRNHSSSFNEYFVSFYYRWHHQAGASLSVNDRNMKMHRIAYNIDDITGDVDCQAMTHTPADGWDIAIKTWTGCEDPECQASSHTGGGYHIADGDWIRIDHYGKYGSSSGSCDGVLRVDAQVSENGLWQQQATAFTDPSNHCDGYGTAYDRLWNHGVDGHPWRDVLFGGFMGLYEYDLTREYYQDYDDAYVSTSRARVEIGNNANWANCTTREIQGTINSWSSSSVSVNVNQGALSSGPAYLFVVDANGEVSSGYPITIGAGGDIMSPGAPSGLSVS